jgi:hypothetical protein
VLYAPNLESRAKPIGRELPWTTTEIEVG